MICALPFYLLAAVWAGSREKAGLTRKQWMQVIALGIAGYYLSSLFDFVGLQYVSAGLERLILFLYPNFAIIINAMVFGQRIDKVQRRSLWLTYAGIVIAYAGELKVDTGNPHIYWGSLLILLCAISYASYIVGSGRLIPVVGVTRFTAYVMLASTVAVLLHFALSRPVASWVPANGAWGYGLALGLLTTVIPSFLFGAGIKRIGSNNMAIVSAIGPVSTIVQAHIILGEPVFAAQIVGTVLVVVGVLLLGWKSSRT